MKSITLLLFLVWSINITKAQFNGQQVIHAKVDPKTKVLKINGKPFTGSKDSLLAMYTVNLISQTKDTSEVDLGIVKITTRIFRKKFTQELQITTFRKQTKESVYAGQWLAIVTFDGEIADTGKKPERF